MPKKYIKFEFLTSVKIPNIKTIKLIIKRNTVINDDIASNEDTFSLLTFTVLLSITQFQTIAYPQFGQSD